MQRKTLVVQQFEGDDWMVESMEQEQYLGNILDLVASLV